MKHKFRDLVDTAELAHMLDKLYQVARIPSAIIDMEGNILTGAGWQRICMDFHRKHPEAEKVCVASDTRIADEIKAGRPYVVYECPHGLVDSSCPIIIEGEHVANVFTGQMLHLPVDGEMRERFARQAVRYGFDVEEYLAALSEVPVFPVERHRAILDLLSDFAGQVAQMGLANLRVREQSRSIRQSEKRFRLLMDSLDALVYVADMETYEVLFINKYGRDLLGDITGRTCWQNIQEGQSGPCAFCTNKYLLDAEGNFCEAHTWEFQNTVTGKWFLIKDRAIEWVDGRIVRLEIATDISARKEVEKDLQDSESRYKAIVEDQVEFVSRYLPGGILTFVNPALARFAGRSTDELLGKSFFPFILEEDREEVRRDIESLGPGKPSCVMENRIRLTNGAATWTQWSHRAILNRQGDIVEYQAVGRDITERKRAEEEKARLERQLLQAQKMEAIGTMAGGIAHDFNNILSIIRGNADLALHSLPAHAPVRTELNEIVGSSNRAKDIVKQILAFSRREKEKKRPFYLCRLLEENMKTLRAAIPTSVDIQVSVPEKCRKNITACRLVLVDPTQIHQLLLNLCSNAVQAMGEKGLLQVTLQEVSVGSDSPVPHPGLAPGIYERITLSDTGCGMDENTLKKAFDPFFTTKGPGKGTGMGLSIVHGIVKNHDAEIFVESETGRGTSFAIYFPAEGAGVPERDGEEHAVTGGEGRILFVDDEESLVTAACRVLKKLGYTATAATASMEALDIFRADPEGFDAVVTDQTMPRMTGVEMAEEILAIRPDLPVILCTGYSNLVDEEAARKSGIYKTCMKPLSLKDFDTVLREALEGKKRD